MSAECPYCKGQQPQGLLCHDCTSKLEADLQLIAPGPITAATDWRAASPAERRTVRGEALGIQTLPWERQRRSWAGFDEELQVTLARLDRSAPNLGGGRSAGIPMPYSETASDRTRELRTTLQNSVEAIWIEGVDPGFGSLVITGPLTGMAAWLLERINRIRRHDQARDIYVAITGKVNAVLRVIYAPAEREAPEERPSVGDDVLAATVATQREIVADILPHVHGIAVSSHRFANWVARGRIVPQGERESDGRLLFRVGDALELARATPARGKRA